MLKRVLKNRVFCNESEAWDAEARLDVAQDICQALNIVDHFSDGDKWEVIPHESDWYVTVRNTSDDDYMDGLFCEVEIDNVWAKCFAAPNREGGDYVLIGKVRWMASDLLDKVTDLVGCGSECALEAKKYKAVKTETIDTNLDQLRGDMSDELIADLKVAWKAGNRKAELLCSNHKMEIQNILKKYGDDMYGMSDLSFFDFRGGFDSLARDILLYADIITDEDIERRYKGFESSRRFVRRCENTKRRSVKHSRKYERSSAVYSQKHADRAKELDGLKGQEFFDALKPGDILEGIWGYNRTITDYFIVKRKTAKRVVVHQIERKNGDQPNDSWGGWSVCPVLPPKEMEREKDRQGTPDGDAIKLADYPKYLRIYKGDYGWENMD